MIETRYATPTSDSTAGDFATFGAVHLDVTDGERALSFWRDLIGLELLSRRGSAFHLGAGGRELVVLHPGATAPLPRHASGLYHLSFHLPSLAEFARVYARIQAAGYPQYPTDHLTHLANYVDDPDGNGLELAFETPRRVGSMGWNGKSFEMTDADGRRHSGRDPIDLDWLLAQVPAGDTRPGLPAGTIVGHVHLRVADTAASVAFYRDIIGFTVNMYAPERPMFDMSAGGSFWHRLAGNVWESAGRPQRPAGTAGLHHYTLALRSEASRQAILDRVAAAGGQIEREDHGAIVLDPSGNRLLLTATGA